VVEVAPKNKFCESSPEVVFQKIVPLGDVTDRGSVLRSVESCHLKRIYPGVNGINAACPYKPPFSQKNFRYSQSRKCCW